MVIMRENRGAIECLDRGEKIMEDYFVHMGFDMLSEAKSILE